MTSKTFYYICDVLALFDGPLYNPPAVERPGGPEPRNWREEMEDLIFPRQNDFSIVDPGMPEETADYCEQSYLVRGRHHWWQHSYWPSEFMTVRPAHSTVFVTPRMTYVAHETRLDEIRGFWAQEVLEHLHGEDVEDYKMLLAEKADELLYAMVSRSPDVWQIDMHRVTEAVLKVLHGADLLSIAPEGFGQLEIEVIRQIDACPKAKGTKPNQ